MSDILFEDLYTYTNKYYKDVAARSARPITKTLADIAKNSPEEYNKQVSNLILYPGDAIVETLGTSYTKLSDAGQLINDLFGNPSANYSDETKKTIKALNLSHHFLQQLSDIDNEEDLAKYKAYEQFLS